MTRPLPPDHAEREAVVAARGVNVVADAGAGTGKTTLLVERLLGLVAPADDGPAIPLDHVAAITFTRKAAGELRLRIREALLEAFAAPALSTTRRERLARALGALDAAHVGTIHAFADRLLRLHPVEARLSPSWEIVEDAGALVRETFEVLLQAIETGTLAAELPDVDPAAAAEAEAALVDALEAGLRAESLEQEYATRRGLDDLVARLLDARDVAPTAPPAEVPDRARFGALVDELRGLVAAMGGDGAGQRYLRGVLEKLDALGAEERPARVLKALLALRAAQPRKVRKGQEFEGDADAWDAWKAFDGDERAEPVRARPLRDDLLGPYASWLARRLVRCAPVVAALYERVKARHRAVDPLDLLLRLRDLLRDDRAVRADLQARFEHVFVDEFQDTDPLQAEIVLFLCEAGQRASSWKDVVLEPGKLTIVGDPKQSIYRFRRADIGVYAAVRELVARGPHRVAKLSANFRSHPGLVAFFESRFDALLGRPAGPGAPTFDPDAGTVANEPLVAAVEGELAARVLLLPLASEDDRKDAYRATEARAVAAWLRRLFETGERRIRDRDGGERPARPGDVAVLVASTFHLPLLFAELDRLAVPYAARGGALFLRDPLHRQFLLALRALADRDDGVAEAALLRPPFFAVDCDDLVRAEAAAKGSDHPGVARARAARDLVRELRRRRLERSPGATARDLLESTAFARAAALGPNGAQRLDALRELCLALDAVAAAEGLDLDAATARLRGWATEPVPLDPPRPVDGGAVEVLTIHQAKGLEFPVVVLWDACADLAARDVRGSFAVDRDGKAWTVELDGLRWNEPPGSDVGAREKRYLDAERKRLVYVAATRARDLLVLPVAGAPDPAYVTGRLAAGAPQHLVETLAPFVIGDEPAWARELPPPAPRVHGDASALAARAGAEWRAAAEEAVRPRFSPSSVTAEAHRDEEERPGEAGAARPPRESRFGPVFGDTVHRAIGLALRDPALGPAAAVARAAHATGLGERAAEAAADVAGALEALARAGLRRPPGKDLQLEYPVALAEGGRLVAGYVDLLAAAPDGLAVVDFKTDAPPRGELAATHPAYVEQVRAYARILEALGLAPAGTVRAGLLFTAEREIRWVTR